MYTIIKVFSKKPTIWDILFKLLKNRDLLYRDESKEFDRWHWALKRESCLT